MVITLILIYFKLSKGIIIFALRVVVEHTCKSQLGNGAIGEKICGWEISVQNLI